MKAIKAIFLVLLSFVWLTPARAADVPSNLIVHAGGLEWAWASPCAPVGGCGDPLVMHDGWSVATTAEFAASFTGYADLLAAFTAPQGSVLCASSYFSSGYTHCDAADVGVTNNLVWNAPAAWGVQHPLVDLAETFVARSEVPEPSSLALFALGLAGVGVARRRQRT